ncbi:MAG: alpha-amylase family glycosyl hydrolase [Burkholderiaceae bacterium]
MSSSIVRPAVLALALGGLAGCGGGGGGSEPPAPPPPTPPAVDVSPVAAADPGSALPEGWQHGAFMEIFVRSYQDSDGDGVGDLKGLVSRLDYLADLGVKGLWLMPVTASQDHDHGYAVADYRGIEAAYGSLADLDELLAQAHARGIGVVLDYVMNHSAATHPLFQNARASSANPYRDWYVWQASAPVGWSVFGANPWRHWTGAEAGAGYYYAPFWDQMPDFNLTHPAVLAHHQDNLRFWLNRGVDGFRFDAVGMLVENGPTAWESQPQNYTIMKGMQDLLAGYQRRTMVCEAPADPQGFGAASACGGAFAFDLSASLVDAARGDTAAIAAASRYHASAPAGMKTFLSNHDSFAGQRLWDQLGGNTAQYRLAAASALLLPGTPFIYYGEEIGLAGAASLDGDPRLRTPMSWTGDTLRAGFSTGTPYRALSANVATNNAQSQQADPQSLHAFYKAMLALRNGHASIAGGSYEQPFASGQAWGFQRAGGGERTLVVFNTATHATALTVAALPPRASLHALYPADGTGASADDAGTARLDLAPQSVRVYQVAP